MTHHIVVSSTLSTSAREAMRDHFTMGTSMHDLLDLSGGIWTLEDAQAAARELAEADYGHIDAQGDFQWDIVPHVPTQLPTDLFDELTPAVEAIDEVVQAAMLERTPENPNPTNVLGVSWAVLLQLQNVLLIAKYAQQGTLTSTDVNTQLPAVAALLARAVRAEVQPNG